MRFFITIVIFVSIFQVCHADKAVVEDFTDCGTWRQRERKGVTPGKWFSADLSLGGAPCKERPDGYAGFINFDLTGRQAEIGFERYKVTAAASVYADAIEFAADARGYDCKVYFILHDANKKSYYTKAIKLKPDGWLDYRLSLDADTVKNFSKMEQPVRLFRVVFALNKATKGSFMIDDIALCGDVSKKSRLTIKPVYNGIVHEPGRNVVLQYLVRNGMNKNIAVSASLNVYDYSDQPVFKKSIPVEVGAESLKYFKFDIGKLPVGSYYTKVKLTGKRINNEFNGWLAVIEPNGKRLNFKPMYFGAQDTTSWNAPYENQLHLTWFKAMGIDLVRYGTTGSRLTRFNNPECLKSTLEQVKPLLDAGILICLSYTESPPGWVQTAPYNHRRMPDKMPEFARQMEIIGKFTAEHPGINYFEWWNEPDISFMNDNLDNYLKCLKVAYANLKKQNSELKVTTGGVTIMHPKEKKNFSRDMYWKGKGFYDIACFHAHGAMSNYVERNNKLEQWLSEKNIKVPMCNTETGERSGYKIPSIKKQAVTLVKKITFARSRHTEFYIWFTLQDYWDMDAAADDSFGLVTCDNQPKPSYVAYCALIKQLANTLPAAPVELDPSIQSYHFKDAAGGDVFVNWPKIAGSSMMFSLKTDKPVIVADMFGVETMINPINGIADVQSLKQPFYLRVPKGAMKGRVSLIKLAKQIFAAPGKVAAIDLSINNPWKENISVKVADSDGKQLLVTSLAPGKNTTRRILKKIAQGTPMGTLTLNLNAEVKGRGIARSIKLPVTINVAYEVISEMADAPELKAATLDCVRELTYDPAIPRWKNADDLSASLKMSADKKNLNVELTVTDDVQRNKYSGSAIWNGDSLQFAVKPMNGKHTEVTLARTSKGSEVWCHISPIAKYQTRWNVPVDVSRKGNKTVYKLKLPFDRLGIKPESGTPFRFSFLVNEDDGLGRIRWIERFGGIGSSKNPAEFGWAVFK